MLHPSTKKLIDKLGEMTLQRKIDWISGEDGAAIYDTEGYRVTLSGSPTELLLSDALGKELDHADHGELAATVTEDGTTYADYIESVRAEANRISRGAESAIDSVLAGLDSDGDGIPDEIDPEPEIAADTQDLSDEIEVEEETVEVATDETAAQDVADVELAETEDIAEALDEPNVAEAVASMADEINGNAETTEAEIEIEDASTDAAEDMGFEPVEAAAADIEPEAIEEEPTDEGSSFAAAGLVTGLAAATGLAAVALSDNDEDELTESAEEMEVAIDDAIEDTLEATDEAVAEPMETIAGISEVSGDGFADVSEEPVETLAEPDEVPSELADTEPALDSEAESFVDAPTAFTGGIEETAQALGADVEVLSEIQEFDADPALEVETTEIEAEPETVEIAASETEEPKQTFIDDLAYTGPEVPGMEFAEDAPVEDTIEGVAETATASVDDATANLIADIDASLAPDVEVPEVEVPDILGDDLSLGAPQTEATETPSAPEPEVVAPTEPRSFTLSGIVDNAPAPVLGGLAATISDAANDTFETANDTVDMATDGIADVAETTLEDVAETVTDIVPDTAETLTEAVSDFASDSDEFVSEAYEASVESVTDVATSGMDAASDTFEAAADMAEDATDTATNLVDDIAMSASDVTGDVTEQAGGILGGVFGAAKSSFDDVDDVIEDVTEDVAETVEAAIEDIKPKKRSRFNPWM